MYWWHGCKCHECFCFTAVREEGPRILRGDAEHVQEHGQPVHGHIRVLRVRQAEVHDRGVLRRHQEVQGRFYGEIRFAIRCHCVLKSYLN